ncbi:MAG: 50S ribosomal protein L5 [Candidatus Woesearchaeota archaeon]
MRTVRLEKITLNVGAGKEQKKLEKGIALLKSITGIQPLQTVAKKRIPSWGLRPGLPIGCKITMRKLQAHELLKRLLEAKDNKLMPTQFDDNGNIAFGIPEYIDIPGVKYEPEIGVMGFEVCVTLERPGYRIRKRRIMKRKIPTRHRVAKEDAMQFMQENYNVKVSEAE